MLGALGVVFGDIGTSPIYALRQGVLDAGAATQLIVMGVLSTIVWAVVLVVTLKYVVYVMRADNEGEGGIVALTALVRAGCAHDGKPAPRVLLLVGLFGAAMFYGDSMITPAVSVLSAVEGLRQISMKFDPFIVPCAIVILVALFAFQSRGTAAVGRWFGPVMTLWFVWLAAVGAYRIAGHPQILTALSPWWALHLALARPGLAFIILGAVILALTGAEALYADMGHFGRRSIRLAWIAVVFPAILIGYFGQGATLLYQPGSTKQPFFDAAPSWALIPTVVMALLATVIASQAVISGAFSMTTQAIELGFLPRMRVIVTSREQRGQVYVPAVNLILFAAVMFLVVMFRTSDRLTAAYGIAVGLTMLATTIQMISLSRRVWHWSLLAVCAVSVPLLVIDGMLVAANVPKIPQGGWFPVTIGIVMFILMTTWNRGREADASRASAVEPLTQFLAEVLKGPEPPARVKGTAIYPGTLRGMTPAALRSNVRHNRVLHQTSIFFANLSESAPRADEKTRIETRSLGDGCYEVVARHGFVERPNLPDLLKSLEGRLGDWRYEPKQTTFFLPREEVVKGHHGDAMLDWRKSLFAMMSFHSASSAEYYGLDGEDVVELGVQVVL
ncbi:potassium transporter Kup [Paraburkholderia sp. DHOC27]|uniref:potassium transporter Kup n=1 Tax=Paraburkholderia sp. DHOC27 TaxID=2303330 RepID=UPI00216B1ECF|nr:KUP/HAK/KT family potassium transporter [Paraburkholderia sp. DHOC27]